LGGTSDQSFFREAIYPGSEECPPKASTKLLSRDHYPNGQWYYSHHEAIESTARIIHFNCIIGQEAKIEKMKAHGKWHI
jgi:hypothetical protein